MPRCPAPLRRAMTALLLAGVMLAVPAGEALAAEHGGGGGGGKKGEEGAPVKMEPPYFFDLPDMLINLNSVTKRQVFLKLKLTVEVGDPADIGTVQHVMPMVLDSMQYYLREKKAEDLAGSAGMYRLRRDLMARIAAPAYPAKIKDVLFKEMLVQ